MQFRRQISRKLHEEHETVIALLSRLEQAPANDLLEKNMKMRPVDYLHQFYADNAAECAAICAGNARRLQNSPAQQ